MRRVVIDDVVEINERMIGYFGLDLSFTNGMSGYDLDLERIKMLTAVIDEVLNNKNRKEFRYNKKDK